MYTQSFSVPDDEAGKAAGLKAVPKAQSAAEAELEQRFEARIVADGRIEPRDWMPEAYRKTRWCAVDQPARAFRDRRHAAPEGNWITRAPASEAQVHPDRQGRGGHGLYSASAAETLGTSREDMLDALHSGKAKHSSIFNYPTLNWADVGVIGWLVDGAAIMNQIPQPPCRAPLRARHDPRLQGRAFHQRQGYEALLVMMKGTQAQRDMVQDAVNRYWWKCLPCSALPTRTASTPARA